MKKLALFVLMPIVLVGLTVSFGLKSSGGKAGKTGSPGESTCVQCHNSFNLNSGGGIVTLSNAMLEANDWMFSAGETYDMDVTIAHDGAAIFGFGVEVLNSSGANSGSLIVSNTDETRMVNASVDGNERTNITHKGGAGLVANTKTFSFQWTAPANDDVATFYVVGNAADNNGGTSGDNIYSISKELTKNTTGIVNQGTTLVLDVFPNPTKDFISVCIPASTKNYVISVYNNTGQLVKMEVASTFSVSELTKGTYYVVLSANKRKISTANFIKI